ncbi:hypothetical protein GH714_010209 [Hevea brasiliensis]|uniref:Protein FAR1-RELATED SEQUENCE n=1 Tax=Hevea brasiliensis TaxID=3981 RepID=A0A6A6LS53_HEVBR|nr:hypothetical protein GH714_010209 [Hevea brasiliensis]
MAMAIQISVIHDENQQIELVGRDQPPSVGMYYASIDVLFDAYLSYAKEKGFSVAKKSASKGNSNSFAAYEEFCDVVSINTTYLVNHYRMPFASIIGVNHHGQSILLGSALISHEDAKTFKWVFSMWLTAMDYCALNAIMIDKCETMKSAIREVMPNTTHRFYIWHILYKVLEKLRGVQKYDKARKEFIALIYDRLNPAMFERNWHEFVLKYHLEGNEWLLKLYNERPFWVLVYVNHIFWARMLSTQRSEGKGVNKGDEEFIEPGFEHNQSLERSLMNDWHNKMFCNVGYPHITEEYKNFKEINKSFNEAADMAMESVSRFERIKACLKDLKLEFQNWDGQSTDANDNVNGDAPDDSDGDLQTQTMIVRNPIVASSQGRPWGNHFRSAFERRPNQGAHGCGQGRGCVEVMEKPQIML